jgi:heme-degrading monooxygenase HmoA
VADDFAPLPQNPYYAVIFTSRRSQEDSGYEAMAAAMFELASQQPGYLGAESARSPSGFGITVSYFNDPESIRAWKQNVRHLVAQRMGKERWYARYTVRVAKIERAYGGPN